MIPRTFPSEFVTPNGKTQAIVYSLPSVSGLKAWIDYIPVKGVANSNTVVENTYAADGYMLVRNLDAITGMTPFKDYIPVYEDATATKPWSTDVGGYIPMYGLFSIQGLFAAGEQGAWYDPSDLTTLFQDAVGTTPVTAVEQPVGLMLDKSKGLVLGSELVASENFTGWTTQTGWTISGGTATATSLSGGNNVLQNVGLVANVTYEITVTCSSISGGSWYVRCGFDTISGNISAAGTYKFRMLRGSNTFVYIGGSAGLTASFTTISVRELPGNHAYQSTSAARPVLSARVNLLTKTEQFDDAAWTKSNATITANAAVAPDGTWTADKLVEDTNNTEHLVHQTYVTTNTSFTYTIYAKASERNWLAVRLTNSSSVIRYAWFNLASGAVGTVQTDLTANIVSVGDGWYRCSTTINVARAGASYLSAYTSTADNTLTYTGDGTSGIYIWGADLRVANDGVGLPAYQRVNTSTDYDTTGFPLYIKPNGSSQFMVTNNIVPGTDKAQVFAGVRKLSDAAVGTLMELSALGDAFDGAFYIRAPNTGVSYTWNSRGTINRNVSSTAQLAPITNVLTGIGDISGDQSTLRVNGTQAAINTADQGTGNYLTYPLYLFARGGTTLWYSGRFYGMILRFGPTLTAAQISSAEAWMNTKTKAY